MIFNNVSVVIGANYGDEGKGLVTDWLCSKHSNPMGIRFNGTAQAGHTVVTENRRHVFHHFSAGTFAKAHTYLASDFVVSPIFFRTEYQELNDAIETKRKGIHPDCLIITPFDIMLNQAIEKARGNIRHGSCGMGFNEAIERSKYEMFSLKISDSGLHIKTRLEAIRDFYIPFRMKQLGITEIEHLKTPGIIERYLEDVKFVVDHSGIYFPYAWPTVNACIFEGAQGLRLDQDYPTFPHVTRSNTGIKNVVEFLRKCSNKDAVHDFSVYYVSRTYLTRHGSGPLQHAGMYPDGVKPYTKCDCKTNTDNEFQGSLRYSVLDFDQLVSDINRDFKIAPSHWNPKKNFVLTCCDQLEDDQELLIIKDNEEICMTIPEFVKALKEKGFDEVYLSFGETRNTIKSARDL